MDQHDTKKEMNQEALGGISTLQYDIMIVQQPHGTKGLIRIEIRVIGQQLDIMLIFHQDGWILVLGYWIHFLVGHIVWFILMFRGQNMRRGM